MTTMFIVAVLLLLLVVSDLVVGNGFSKDGTIDQMKFAQNAVVGNENRRSLTAIKLQTCTVILDVYKQKSSGSPLNSDISGSIMFENKHLRSLFVGKMADCQQVRLLCNELDAESRASNGVSLTAPAISLKLADNSQISSMEREPIRQLAYNALVLNTDTSDVSKGFGDIYKVDVSGNFFRCESTCIGTHAQQIGLWLRDRAMLCDPAVLAKKPSEHSTAHPKGAISTSTDKNSIPTTLERLFEISSCCLQENYAVEDMAAGNYSVSVTVLQEEPATGRTVRG